MEGKTFLDRFPRYLSEYEQTEIVEYHMVYYINMESQQLQKEKMKKIKPNGDETYNDGFDTKDGEYLTQVKDHIGYRYEIKKVVGKGSFG
jgi:dual specificity tyrosine-phosphorylation-regulated kinase 2/3/4